MEKYKHLEKKEVFKNNHIAVYSEKYEKLIIPIYGIAESLNVAMACGIILYKTREILGAKN